MPIPIQIFISYARDDNALLPGFETRGTGFVDTMRGLLEHVFRDLGPDRPKLWYDTEGIDRGDQFSEVIEKAIEQSDILLVVLSPNWLARPFCLRELELFQKRWSHESDTNIRRQIVLACKREVPLDERPDLLRGQEGYKFYFLERAACAGDEEEFFDPRRPGQDDRFYNVVKELARYIRKHFIKPEPPIKPETPQNAPAPAKRAGRTIYIAKPVKDVRAAYGRLTEELAARGHTVLPEIGQDIPLDETAVDYIDTALKAAEFSIHLIGEKAGPSPEGQEPIAKLQLARAALRAGIIGGDALRSRFERLIWAPHILPDAEGLAPRDPFAVLAKFGTHVDSDNIVGDPLSKFVDYLLQYIDRTAPKVDPTTAPPILDAHSTVFIDHAEEDEEFAVAIAKQMKSRKIEAILPTTGGNPADVKALNRQYKQDCDSIVLCWWNASEVWVKSAARELAPRRLRELGRNKEFACRGVIAGPPSVKEKKKLIDLTPSSEIDIVVDLRDCPTVDPSALDPLIKAATAPRAA